MTLPIIHSDATYQLHAPTFEIWPGGYVTEYFEAPQRAEIILNALQATNWAHVREPDEGRHDSLPLIVHDADYVGFIRDGYREWLTTNPQLPPDQPPTYYPGTVPPPRWRRRAAHPKKATEAYGYYTFDLTAPLVEGTYEAALGSARCAMTAANLVLYGEPAAYALCRPPGHHAGRDFSGGYCYFNNTAIAAKILSMRGPVAVLDIDYHHGNGTQDIFYTDDRVLTISLHADPAHDYPYFVGYADELGEGEGEGNNLNVPLPLHTTGEWYLQSIDLVLDRVHLFQPWALVVAVGFDTFGGDPISKFALMTEDYPVIARRIKALKLPTVLVQEGGYNSAALGRNAAAFLGEFAA